MSDDDRLAALFHAAASDADAPPPGFSHDDVLATSRRITVRRRSAAIGAAAVIGLAGLGAAVVLPGMTEPDATSSAAAPAEPLNAPNGAAEEAAGGGDVAAPHAAPPPATPATAAPGSGDAADTGRAPTPDLVPSVPTTGPLLGPGLGECADRQDPRLRALLEQALPEVAGAPAAATTDVCLPGGDRYVSLQVVDGAARGSLVVASLPPGSVVQVAPGTEFGPTGSGGTVLVGSTSDVPDAPAPFADRLAELVRVLGPRL